MLERHQDMWAGQLWIIKCPPHRNDVKPGKPPINQPLYRAGPSRRELIDEHVEKMHVAEVIKLYRSE